MSSTRIHPLISILTICCLLLILPARLFSVGSTQGLTNWLYGTAVVLSAVALVLGVLNVLMVHVRRIRTGESEWSFSLVLVLCLAGTVAAGLVTPEGVFSPILSWLFENLIAPGEAALFALLPFFLAVAAWRYLRIDREGGGWMLAGVLLMIFVQMPAAADSLLAIDTSQMQPFFDGPLTAVVRGVLLGGALTMVVAALRLMLGRH